MLSERSLNNILTNAWLDFDLFSSPPFLPFSISCNENNKEDTTTPHQCQEKYWTPEDPIYTLTLFRFSIKVYSWKLSFSSPNQNSQYKVSIEDDFLSYLNINEIRWEEKIHQSLFQYLCQKLLYAYHWYLYIIKRHWIAKCWARHYIILLKQLRSSYGFDSRLL